MDSHLGGATEGDQAEPQSDEPRLWMQRDVQHTATGDTQELSVC